MQRPSTPVFFLWVKYINFIMNSMENWTASQVRFRNLQNTVSRLGAVISGLYIFALLTAQSYSHLPTWRSRRKYFNKEYCLFRSHNISSYSARPARCWKVISTSRTSRKYLPSPGVGHRGLAKAPPDLEMAHGFRRLVGLHSRTPVRSKSSRIRWFASPSRHFHCSQIRARLVLQAWSTTYIPRLLRRLYQLFAPGEEE